MPQPWRGLIGIGLSLAIGTVITVALGYGWGALDPSFAAARAGGAGFTTGNLFVLFAFFFYVYSAVNAAHWPWSTPVRQPWTGLGELTILLVPTFICYAVLVLPNTAVWATPGKALLTVPTLIGWFYSLVVSSILTGLLTENRPWNLAKHPAGVAALALVGNAVLGTGLYFALRKVAELLMGPANAAALGSGVALHAAQLGVCWAFWMVAWANIWSNKPTRFGTAANIAIRGAVTFILAMSTYLLYYFVLAHYVLHEPTAGGTLFGNALGFMDWAILWMLWYVLFLGSYGLPRATPSPEDATQSS